MHNNTSVTWPLEAHPLPPATDPAWTALALDLDEFLIEDPLYLDRITAFAFGPLTDPKRGDQSR